MNEATALSKMVAPGQRRPGKPKGGVVQIWTTNACNLSCFSCTQLGNVAGKPRFITVEHFEQACLSLHGYWGTVGMFGANCALHPQFPALCQIMSKHFPKEQLGIWCNNPMTLENAQIMAQVFNPAVSNLNVHLDANAYTLFKKGWPESRPFGLTEDSRHSPPFVSMRDLNIPEEERWELISKCDINQHWSAMIGVFRGQLRAWFCEIAGSMSMLHQDDPDWPDTGLDPTKLFMVMGNLANQAAGRAPMTRWWELPMSSFTNQVRQHCHDCGVPMRGHGQLAQETDNVPEQTSVTHVAVFKSKRRRPLQMVTDRTQLGEPLGNVVKYLQNSHL